MKLTSFLLLALLLVPAACAQEAADGAMPDAASDPDGEALTETEEQVQALLEEDGIHVVHFWAPWCHNSKSEFRNGWHRVVEENEDIDFIFVTVYNDGELGEATLRRFSIPERVRRFAQPDDGPSDIHANRRRVFLGRPLLWTPTTWIFHKNGRLAYALNYGEASVDLMNMLLENLRKDWSH